MKSFVLLLKIQLFGLFGINKALHADAARAKRAIALGALAVVAIVAFVAIYAGGVSYGLVQIGLTDAVPFVAVFVGAVVGAVAAFLKANGVLFAFKDYDLVMSLPVSIASVVLSRIASLYAMSLAFSVLVMVPALVVYGTVVGVSVVDVIFMVLAIFLAPLLPLAIAIVLAALIAAISSRFKHANIVVIVLSLVATLAVVVCSFMFSGQASDSEILSVLGAEAVAKLQGVFPPAAWAAEGIVQGDALAFAAFAALNVAAALLLVALLTRIFIPVNALLMSARPRSSFTFGDSSNVARVRTPFQALLAKEARMLLATPVYALNGAMGYVLVLVAAVVIVAGRVTGLFSLNMLPPGYESLVGGFLPWVLAFCFGISSTTAPSVSLEGSARWLMLTAPVSSRTVLGAKAALNLALAVPTALVAGVVISLVLPLDPVTIIAVFVVPLAVSLFSTFVGLFMDARHPRYDWTTVYEPVKRGLPVFVVMFGGMLLVAVGMGMTALVGTPASVMLAMVVGVGSVALFFKATGERLIA